MIIMAYKFIFLIMEWKFFPKFVIFYKYFYIKFYINIQNQRYIFFMKTGLILIIFLFINLSASTKFKQSLTQWTFRYEGASRDYPTTIPSTLSWDLIDSKVVSSDPYYRDNFLQFYEYETKDASYKTSFSVPSSILNSKHQYLIF